MIMHSIRICPIVAAIAATMFYGCRSASPDLLTLDVLELSGADTLTDWTLDRSVRPAESFELAPDRPLAFPRIVGYDGSLLLGRTRDSIFWAGPDGRFTTVFSRKGRGPQEYLDCTPRVDLQGRVLVLDAMQRRAYTYLPDGTFVSRQDSVSYADIHFFPDGSRAVIEMASVKDNRIFSVLAPDGTVLRSGPQRVETGWMIIQPYNFFAQPDGSCYLKNDNIDSLYHLYPDRTEVEAVLRKPAKPADTVRDDGEDGVVIQNNYGRFIDRSCRVFGHLLFYSVRDDEKKVTHHFVCDLRSGEMLYHGHKAPLLRVGDRDVRTWPEYVKGRDAWCKLTRADAAALIDGYDDESNDAYLHITLR